MTTCEDCRTEYDSSAENSGIPSLHVVTKEAGENLAIRFRLCPRCEEERPKDKIGKNRYLAKIFVRNNPAASLTAT